MLKVPEKHHRIPGRRPSAFFYHPRPSVSIRGKKGFLRGFHRYDTSSGCATFSPFGAEKGICAIRVARFFKNFRI